MGMPLYQLLRRMKGAGVECSKMRGSVLNAQGVMVRRYFLQNAESAVPLVFTNDAHELTNSEITSLCRRLGLPLDAILY